MNYKEPTDEEFEKAKEVLRTRNGNVDETWDIIARKLVIKYEENRPTWHEVFKRG